MSPEQYRAKWGLPSDYPMVAPNYAKARSDLAKAIGLGQTRNGPTTKQRKSTGRAFAKSRSPAISRSAGAGIVRARERR